MLRQVLNLDADPYPPDTYCCPLSLYWLEDAVTPQGYSFIRVRIEQSKTAVLSHGEGATILFPTIRLLGAHSDQVP
jgi:hypothetical protein